MKKIVLHVSEEHLQTVMQLLTNLKAGLIKKIETTESDEPAPPRKSAYTPKRGNVIYEGEKPSGKYISPSVYKNRLKKGE